MALISFPKAPIYLLSPSLQLIFVRNLRKELPIKRYKDPCYDKKLLLAACEPVKKIDRRPAWERCKGQIHHVSILESTNIHQYDQIIGNELKQKLLPAQFVLFYHLNNNLKDDTMFNRNALIKAGFSYEYHNTMALRLAVEDTKFRSLLPILTSVNSNLLAISNEINFQKFLQADKKLVNCILLFAYVYGRLVSKVELVKLARMPDLQTIRGELLTALNNPGALLTSSINCQLQLLSNGLDARKKQLEETSSNTSNTKPTE